MAAVLLVPASARGQVESSTRAGGSTRPPATRPRPVIDTLVYDTSRLDAATAVNAGLTAVVLDVDIYPRGFHEIVEALAAWTWTFRKADAAIVRVTRAVDLDRAANQKKLGIILASQDGQVLGPSTYSTGEANLGRLALLYELGLRVLQLTHNDRNALGDPQGTAFDGGLSAFGRRVVEEMASLGMVVDLSHCGEQTMRDAIMLSKKPCMVTHAGCRAICDSPRNKSDEQMRLLAKKGGLFGVFALNPWLKREAVGTLDDAVAHVEHALRVAGTEHVAFGSDGPLLGDASDDRRVDALNGPERISKLCDALAKRGHKAAVLEKLAGGNFVRLFRDVCG